MEPMGSQGVAKGGPKDALVGPGAAKSAQGSECPGKGQGTHFFGVPFGTPIWLHLCSKFDLFFIDGTILVRKKVEVKDDSLTDQGLLENLLN